PGGQPVSLRPIFFYVMGRAMIHCSSGRSVTHQRASIGKLRNVRDCRKPVSKCQRGNAFPQVVESGVRHDDERLRGVLPKRRKGGVEFFRASKLAREKCQPTRTAFV